MKAIRTMAVVVLLAAAGVGWLRPEWIHASIGAGDADRVAKASHERASKVIVEVDATVIREMPDDGFGALKQQFLV